MSFIDYDFSSDVSNYLYIDGSGYTVLGRNRSDARIRLTPTHTFFPFPDGNQLYMSVEGNTAGIAGNPAMFLGLNTGTSHLRGATIDIGNFARSETGGITNTANIYLDAGTIDVGNTARTSNLYLNSSGSVYVRNGTGNGGILDFKGTRTGQAANAGTIDSATTPASLIITGFGTTASSGSGVGNRSVILQDQVKIAGFLNIQPSAGNASFNLTHANRAYQIFCNSSWGLYDLNASADRIILDSSGNFFVKTLSTNGAVSTINGTGQLSVSSDQRLKSIPSDIPDGALDTIMQLKPREYKWLADPSQSINRGFIAQEVETILPTAVDGKKYEYQWRVDRDGNPILDENGNLILTDVPRYRGLNTTSILATVVKAIQEQQAQIDQIKQHLGL